MITLNPHSDIQVMGKIKYDYQNQVQNAKNDVTSRNADVQQAKKDYAAGNMNGAKFERQQATATQADIKSDRTTLSDVRNGALQLKSDFEGRRESISNYYQAEHSGNSQAAQQAFQAAKEFDTDVRSNLMSLQPKLAVTNSVDESV
jgi:hypothetical protein